MSIKFFNVRTGETKIVKTEPMLAAFYNSSDQGPNAHGGQDFGWRLAPETVAQIKSIKRDQVLLDRIRTRYQLADEVKDTDILRWISQEEDRQQAEVSVEQEDAYNQQYQDELRQVNENSNKQSESTNGKINKSTK